MHTHTHTWHQRNPHPQCKTLAPGINLDEVQRNLVRARGQVLVRLLDVMRLGLGVVTTTDLAKSAACRDLDTVPALEVFVVLEVGGDRLESRRQTVVINDLLWRCTLSGFLAIACVACGTSHALVALHIFGCRALSGFRAIARVAGRTGHALVVLHIFAIHTKCCPALSGFRAIACVAGRTGHALVVLHVLGCLARCRTSTGNLFDDDVVNAEAFVVRSRVQLSVNAHRELTVHSIPSACHLDLFLVPAVVPLTAQLLV